MSVSNSLLAAAIVLACVGTVSAQTFVPKTIQFKGDTEYTSAELMAAADLHLNKPLTAAEMNDHTKLLMDTGLFDNINYSFNGQDLVFQILPSRILYTPRLENFPFPLSKDFVATLQKAMPLYHGLLPAQGKLVDAFHDALVGELAAKGIDAIVTSTDSDTDVARPFISFSIATPPIEVGEIQMDGASLELAGKARQIAAQAITTPYNTAGTPSSLETNLSNYYREMGYLEASVQATPQPNLEVTPQAVRVPLQIVIKEGPQYRLAKVVIPPDLVVTQEFFDKQSLVHPGDIASLPKLRNEWLFVVRQYHNRGCIKAVVHATPSYNQDQRTVTYTLTADPGPAYSMGTLKIVNVSDDIQKELHEAWPLQPGAVFNEGSILAMTATQDVNPVLERLFVHNELRYTLHPHEDTHIVDVDLTLERKH